MLRLVKVAANWHKFLIYLFFMVYNGGLIADVQNLVVLPDSFRGMGAWRNSMETQQSGHAPRSGPENKNGRSSAKDGAPERLGCGTVKENVSQILQRMSAGVA